jgi:hypothetical protein
MSKSSVRIPAKATVTIAFVATLLSFSASSHHSHAMFDGDTTLNITGTVDTLDWTNPHVWLHVNATDEAGEPMRWSLEMGSPANIARRGWRPRLVSPGDSVTVALHPLRDGGTIGSLVAISLPDGTQMGDVEYLN